MEVQEGHCFPGGPLGAPSIVPEFKPPVVADNRWSVGVLATFILAIVSIAGGYDRRAACGLRVELTSSQETPMAAGKSVDLTNGVPFDLADGWQVHKQEDGEPGVGSNTHTRSVIRLRPP